MPRSPAGVVVAAGTKYPPRRRTGHLLAALMLAPFVAALLGGCGTGRAAAPSRSTTQGPGTKARVEAKTTLGGTTKDVSLRQVEQRITVLYKDHPGISRYAAQDVVYSQGSFNAVLKTCTDQGPAKTSVEESGRLLACAPLIFFLYSYGHKEGVPLATQVAEDLYMYAVSETEGPVDPRTVLGGVLRSWGLPVASTPSGTRTSNAPTNSPAVVALVTAVEKAMSTERGVHVAISGYQKGHGSPVETIIADMSARYATESIRNGSALASIRITPTAAYLSGNIAGLTSLIGLSAASAKKAGNRWVEAKARTTQYNALSTEDTLASLPASVLPLGIGGVTVSSTGSATSKVRVLSWKATVNNANEPLIEKLVVSAGTSPLPLSEKTVAGGDTQEVSFTDWGQEVTVAPPPPTDVVTYSRLLAGRHA